jgi:hypothetical protein
MFVEKKNTFTKTFYAKTSPTGKVDVRRVPELADNRRTKDAIGKLESTGFKLHTVTFRLLDWGTHCKIMRECLRTDAETSMRYLDSYEVDLKKLCTVLEDWDFTRIDNSGEVVKTTPGEQTIKMLHPTMAEFLLKLYEEEGEISPETEKNS